MRPSDLPSFVGKLRVGYLQRDTRFTNHGFHSGQAQPRQSVLEAGTSVLMDPTGVPVVRCLSGSPLLPPVAITGSPSYTGKPWAGFTPGQLVASTTLPQSIALATSRGSQAQAPSSAPSAPLGVTAANLIVDGGFESGLVAPWGTGIYEPKPQIFWGSANATATVVAGVAHSGASSLQIVNSTPFTPNVRRSMSQQVQVRAGASYCLSFWARSQGSQAGILSIAVDKALSHRVGVTPGTYDWTRFSSTFTAEAATIDIRLISENVGKVWVDDVSVAQGKC